MPKFSDYYPEMRTCRIQAQKIVREDWGGSSKLHSKEHLDIYTSWLTLELHFAKLKAQEMADKQISAQTAKTTE